MCKSRSGGDMPSPPSKMDESGRTLYEGVRFFDARGQFYEGRVALSQDSDFSLKPSWKCLKSYHATDIDLAMNYLTFNLDSTSQQPF